MKKLMASFIAVSIGVFACEQPQPSEVDGPAFSMGKVARVSQDLVCKDNAWNARFPCGLPGTINVPEARAEGTFPPSVGSYGTGNAHGEIKYDANAAGSMHVDLHGLQANTWYLVTAQDPTGLQFAANGATCLFGVKGTPTVFTFCDVALVKTNAGGNVNAWIPTDGGLTPIDPAGSGTPVCTISYVPGLTPAPNYGAGTYTGITMVVKNVGVGSDGTAPNCGDATWDLLSPLAELFEAGALPNFMSP